MLLLQAIAGKKAPKVAFLMPQFHPILTIRLPAFALELQFWNCNVGIA
jgi:hypothetical protein